MQVGSELTLDTKLNMFRPYLEKRFFDRFYFGEYELQKSAEYTLDSERPLFFQINDPQGRIELTKNGTQKSLSVRDSFEGSALATRGG